MMTKELVPCLESILEAAISPREWPLLPILLWLYPFKKANDILYYIKEHVKKIKTKQKFRHVRQIEESTTATVTIATTPSAENLAKCHSQQQSPLFHLPTEIRQHIFMFALAQSFSDEAAICHRWDGSIDQRQWHPDSRAQLLCCTSLLLTCRRIWLEANSLSLPRAEVQFFILYPRPHWTMVSEKDRNGRQVKDDHVFNEFLRMRRFADRLTPGGRRALGHVRLFVNTTYLKDVWEYWPVSLFKPSLGCSALAPRVLTITVRHMDWRSERALELKDGWLRSLFSELASTHIKEIRLQLETDEDKIDQLRVIVDRLKRIATEECQAASDRTNEPGNRSRSTWILQPRSPPEHTWCMPRTKWPRYRMITLVWKSQHVETMEGTEQETKEMQEKSGKSEMRDGGIQDQGLSKTAETYNRKRAKWIARWEKQNSLLCFVDDGD